MRRPVILLGALLLGSAAGEACGQGRTGTADRLDPTVDIRFDQRLGQRLPADARVTDDRGVERTFDDLWTERPVVFALVYYECPMLCGLVLEGLVKCLKLVELETGEDYDLRVLSIDPGEGVELAAAARQTLLARLDAADDDGVRFLRADQETIDRVTETVGFRYVYDPVSDEYAHAAGIVVTTPDRVLSRYFYGIDFSPRDVRLGLVEASDGKVGSLVDQLLLLCLHYDPSTGRYGGVILGSLRLGGLLTVLILAAAIVQMSRRGRRRREPGHV